MEVVAARGSGRSCCKCNIKIGAFEDCVEVDTKPYHTGCNPLVKPTRAALGTVTVEFVQSLQNPQKRF